MAKFHSAFNYNLNRLRAEVAIKSAVPDPIG